MDHSILLDYGAVIRKHSKGDLIIREGTKARFFFTVYTGEIKMYNTGDDGQEFIQGIFKEGESFGEPPLMLESEYPASAKALTDCEVLVIEKTKLLRLPRSSLISTVVCGEAEVTCKRNEPSPVAKV